MASSKKGSLSNIFVWIILVLLIVGLAGFGVTNFGGNIQAVASVGDTEIDVNDYARELQNELRAIAAQVGTPIPLSSALSFGIDQSVMARLLSNAALENENNRLGVSVGDAQVAEELRSIPAFQGISGSFDREAYRFALQQSGQSEAEFEQSVRTNAARSLLQGSVYGGLVAPEALVTRIMTFIGETRDVTWLQLSSADLDTEVPTPNDADLRAYYQANETAFTAPETKKITYVWVTPSMLIDDIEVDEEALKSLYDERSDEYIRPERRLLERLVFADEAEAAAAMARIDAGEAAFEDLVTERGLALADIDLGDVSRDVLDDEVAEAVFGLQAPGVLGPLPSALGPAIFRMNAILAAQETSYDAARPALLAEFASDKARRMIAESASSVDDLLAGGATLEELGDESDLTLATIDWTTAQDQDIAAYQAFQQAALLVTVDDFPEVVELEDGGIFALRLDAIVPPTLRPFDDVRDVVVSGWQLQETETLLTAKSEELTAQINAETTMINLGVVVQTQSNLRRDAFVENTPGAFMIDLFEMELGELRSLSAPGTVYVMRLDAINDPDLDTPDSVILRESLSGQLAQNIAQDVLEAYIASLQNQAGISINQAAVNAVHAQFP